MQGSYKSHLFTQTSSACDSPNFECTPCALPNLERRTRLLLPIQRQLHLQLQILRNFHRRGYWLPMRSRTYMHKSAKPLISVVIRIRHFQSRVSVPQKTCGDKLEICHQSVWFQAHFLLPCSGRRECGSNNGSWLHTRRPGSQSCNEWSHHRAHHLICLTAQPTNPSFEGIP